MTLEDIVRIPVSELDQETLDQMTQEEQQLLTSVQKDYIELMGLELKTE